MYKVMIVDDEPLIREGLRTIVEWEDCGFQVAAVAVDGMDALSKIPQAKPDLMVIDVRMPGMTGLQLMQNVQEQYDPAPLFIVLSGHADFEYARQALSMRAEGYILKPVDEEELEDALRKVKLTLDKRRSEGSSPSGQAWSRERTVLSLLSVEGEEPPEEALGTIRLGGAPYSVLLIKLQNREEIDAATATSVKTRLSDAFDASGKGVVFSLESNLGLVLSADETDMPHVYREIRRVCSESGLDFTAVAGDEADGLAGLSQSLRSAEEGLKNRFLLEGDRIYPAKEAAAPAERQSDAKVLGESESEKLLLALDLGNAEAAASWVRETADAMRAARVGEPEVKSAFAQSFTAALAKLEQRRPELKERCRAFAAEVLKLYGEYRLSGLTEALTELVAKMADSFRGYGSDQQMQKMIELIRRNYADNLKLESLAEVFGYNSSYLGKLFRNYTGESFNTYLDKVRIEQAKELLEQGLKVYQVAERVGYSNVDYFHGKFRKYEGVSPSAYRKK